MRLCPTDFGDPVLRRRTLTIGFLRSGLSCLSAPAKSEASMARLWSDLCQMCFWMKSGMWSGVLSGMWLAVV